MGDGRDLAVTNGLQPALAVPYSWVPRVPRKFIPFFSLREEHQIGLQSKLETNIQNTSKGGTGFRFGLG